MGCEFVYAATSAEEPTQHRELAGTFSGRDYRHQSSLAGPETVGAHADELPVSEPRSRLVAHRRAPSRKASLSVILIPRGYDSARARIADPHGLR